MKRILVTGGAGFIGSNLIKKLLTLDQYRIYSIDNFDPFYSRLQKANNLKEITNHPNFTFIEGDISDNAALQQAAGVDVIIHLAAKTGVRPSIHDPRSYYEVNVQGTQNMLEFARIQNVRQFIFASSSSVYGINKNLPWKEDDRLLPISPYAASKLSSEMLGHVYSHLYGIRFLALRFFTVYGPSQRPDLAIHKFFKSILQEKPIPVFGDGSTSRDYTFVEDIVSGIISSITYTNSLYEIINLGNHHGIPLSELISSIETICNK
ncbi:MAG: NAD-dependent epimerase/dehydratase family protein, partial [Ginsengibacter sp.]